jgi:DNA-binding SARP family transcriptional activator
MSGGQHTRRDHGRLRLTTLGGASLWCAPDDGEPIQILGPGKPLAVLVYLAFSPGRSATREHLIDLLWADLELEAARHALRQTLWYLRQRLGPDVILARDGNLTLCTTLEADRDEFLEALDRLDFERAVELYGGEFLPVFAAPGGADFERWADLERFRLRSLFLRAAESLVRDWLSTGHAARAKELATRARDADPNDESAWRLLLEALLAANDRVAAEIEAHALEQGLAEADLPPEPATRSLLAVVRETPTETESEAPEHRTLIAELIGREEEFSAIVAAWQAARSGQGRHVHMTGAAGLGKTRLLSDVHARLRAMGARAVQVRANPGERHVPYALASELALALADLRGAAAISQGAAGALVALNPSLSALYSAPPDRATDLEALRHREIALAELLAAVADEQPVALLIDDVHWADAPSRQTIVSLLGKLGAQRVLLASTARLDPEGAIAGSVTERLTLQPLSENGTQALLASLGSLPTAPWAERLPEELHAATLGSPLLILETLRHALEQGWVTLKESAWDCPDPGRLTAELARGGALARRIEELPRHEGSLLLLLSVAGTPLNTSVLAEAAGREREAVLNDLWGMELRGLVSRKGDERAPAHDEIAARTLEAASPDALRAVHGSIGRVLADGAGVDASTLHRAAHHLARARDEDRLSGVFRRWVSALRRRGDKRSLNVLAAEVLGERPDATNTRRLVASLPLRARLGLESSRRLALTAGLAGAVGVLGIAGLAAVLSTPPPPPPDAVLIAVANNDSSSTTVYSVPVYHDGWAELTSLDVLARGERRAELSKLARVLNPVFGPDGKSWLYGRVMPDSGERDLFLMSAQGSEMRLTSAPGDDGDPSWAPDGRQVVFETVRWSPRHHYDLAVHDVKTGEVRALTRSDHADVDPRWSPDGTRVAFVRIPYEMRPPELCWVSLDRRAEQCARTRGYVPISLAGWYDQEQVLAVLDSAGHELLARVHLQTASVRVLDRRHGKRLISADGRWVACFSDDETTRAPAWLVYPVNWPDQARRVDLGSIAPSGISLLWAPPTTRPRYLAHVEILAPSNPIPLDVAYRLRVQGSDIEDSPIALPVLLWHSADTSVATVDSAGTLQPLRVGTVTVHVSAGGWRSDSVRVAIQPPTVSTVLEERWSGELAANWAPYGVPRPELTSGPESVPALWHRGDSTFHSGVYSRRVFSAARGLGLEAWIATPVDALQWQSLTISLDPGLDDAALAAWDHRTGSPPTASGPSWAGCYIRYPSGDGYVYLSRLALSAGIAQRTVAADARLRSGSWYRVRMQIFPDGRCGIALDGQPLWRGESQLSLDRHYRVRLEGKSVSTKILVGPLEVWQGVRGDVDWSALDGQSRAPTP